MGAFLDKPKTEKYNEGSEGAGLRYGLSSMQVSVEDASYWHHQIRCKSQLSWLLLQLCINYVDVVKF